MNNTFNKKKGSVGKPSKKRKAQSKKLHTAAKEKPLLPILCRPGAEMSMPLYLIGWALRSLVLFCGVFGMTLFIGDGFGIYGEEAPGSVTALLLVSLALTVVCSAAAWNSRTRIIVPLLGIGAGIGILFVFTSNPFVVIWDGIRCVINKALMHMVTLGYISFGDYIIGPESYAGSDTLIMGVGCAVLATVIAVILGFSLLRKVHAFPAVLLSFIIIFPVFMYNLTKGNAGVSMVLIFIFGEIALLIYERKFSNYEARRVERKEKKAAKKLAKKEKKQAKKNARATLDASAKKAYAIALELTEDKKEARIAKAAVYKLDKAKKNADKKAAKKAKKEASLKAKKARKEANKAKAKEAKAKKTALAKERSEFKKLPKEEQLRRLDAAKTAKEEKKEAARQKRRARLEAETNVRKTLSASGYAGGIAILSAALAVWLPFSVITGNFITIDFINDPVSVAREYITAYLKGDDIDLNNMSDVAELTPRTLTYDSPDYKHLQMLAIETERTDPVYLRGWIGMRFDPATGSWTSGTNEEVKEYRNDLFGKTFTPDILKTQFLSYIFPHAVNITKPNVKLRFSNFGFDVRQIHLRRINGESLLVYTPPTINTDLGILEYGSLEKNQNKYSAYFDSIYSSRFFDLDVNYSTVSFTTQLNDPDVSEGFVGLENYFYLFRQYTDIHADAKKYLEENTSGEMVWYTTSNKGTVKVSLSDYSELDRLFLEECEKMKLPEFFGESILSRYLSMTDEEQEKLRISTDEFIETEKNYLDWANLHYGSTELMYGNTVNSVANTLLKDAGYSRNLKKKGAIPTYVNKEGLTVNQHDVVMTVINHLRNNFTYTLEPTPYTGDSEMSVLDSFLTETKNGYCTHFATAAAALLREYGYTVRYCEGYLVTDFARDYQGAATYKGIAHDDNAHAWIEVYYPLIGWVAYETVPDYMAQMYDTPEVEDETNEFGEIIEEKPPIEEPVPVETEPPVTEPPEVTTAPHETPILEDPDEANSKHQLMILMIVGISIVVGLILFFIAKLIIKRIARKAENAVADRHRHIITAMDTDLLKTGKIDTLPIARELDDSIFRIFDLLGYPPRTGEQYSEYAARLELDFGGMTDYSLSQIFDLVAKTEFGGGLTPEEMYILADFTDRLTVSAYAGLTRFEKIKYRYLKRVI